MELSRRQLIGGLAAAAAVPALALIPKDPGPWVRVRDISEEIWNGDLMVDGRNGRFVGVFWNGATYRQMPFIEENRATYQSDEEADAWTSQQNYRRMRAEA
jgi:hypothetical protein